MEDFENIDFSSESHTENENPQEETIPANFNIKEEFVIIQNAGSITPHSHYEKKENTANEYLSFKWQSKSSDHMSVSHSKVNKNPSIADEVCQRNKEIDDEITARYKQIKMNITRFEEQSTHHDLQKSQEIKELAFKIGSALKELTMDSLNSNGYNKVEQFICEAIHFLEISGHLDFLANCFDIKGELHRRKGEYKESLEALEKSKNLKIELFGNYSPSVAMTLYEISSILMKLCKYSEAKDHLNSALELLKKDPEGNKISLIQLYLMQVSLLIQNGRLDEAESLIKKSKDLSKGDKESMLTKAIETAYLDLYTKRRENEKVKSILKKMFKAEMERTNRSPLRIAKILRKLGSVNTKLGYFNKSVDELNKGLEILKKIFNFDHPEIAAMHYQLGDSYMKLGNYAKSEEELDISLKMNQKSLGHSHPAISAVYHSLGNLQYMKKEYVKAEELYNLSLNLDKIYYEEDHVEFAETYRGLADVYKIRGKNEKALEFYKKTLNIKIRMLGNDHNDVLKLNNIINKLTNSFL